LVLQLFAKQFIVERGCVGSSPIFSAINAPMVELVDTQDLVLYILRSLRLKNLL